MVVNARYVSGFIIGENKYSSVAVWNSILVSKVPLIEPGEYPGDLHMKIQRSVIESSGNDIRNKGYNNWAVGMTCSSKFTSTLLIVQISIFFLRYCHQASSASFFAREADSSSSFLSLAVASSFFCFFSTDSLSYIVHQVRDFETIKN